MLLSKIQRDLFDFTQYDPDDFGGLLEFWYLNNSEALSAALTAADGLKLIVNVDSFSGFEEQAKKLFLVADTLVLRDTRKFTQDETEFRSIPMPKDGNYIPGWYENSIEELSELSPSPMTLLYKPQLYWTSTTKLLNNGLDVAYAGWDYHSIPREFVDWISSDGRKYLETGNVVYAPFIPPLEMELEFIKSNVNVSDYFNATPCFHQNYDWLQKNKHDALLAVQMPFLDNLDITTISKVKEDHYEDFKSFSDSMITAVEVVKSSLGTEQFVSEVRNIQRNLIDAEIDNVSKTLKKIETYSSLRKAGIAIGLLGLDAAAFLGANAPAIVSGLAAGGVAAVADQVMRLKEKGQLKEGSYFLWKLNEASAKFV